MEQDKKRRSVTHVSAEQMNINTEGLKVGSKLWNYVQGWLVVVRLKPGTVWVRPDAPAPTQIKAKNGYFLP